MRSWDLEYFGMSHLPSGLQICLRLKLVVLPQNWSVLFNVECHP